MHLHTFIQYIHYISVHYIALHYIDDLLYMHTHTAHKFIPENKGKDTKKSINLGNLMHKAAILQNILSFSAELCSKTVHRLPFRRCTGHRQSQLSILACCPSCYLKFRMPSRGWLNGSLNLAPSRMLRRPSLCSVQGLPCNDHSWGAHRQIPHTWCI